MVLKCLGDQSQQLDHTGFKTSISFSELPWWLFLISRDPLKSHCPEYCTPSLNCIMMKAIGATQALRRYFTFSFQHVS